MSEPDTIEIVGLVRTRSIILAPGERMEIEVYQRDNTVREQITVLAGEREKDKAKNAAANGQPEMFCRVYPEVVGCPGCQIGGCKEHMRRGKWDVHLLTR